MSSDLSASDLSANPADWIRSAANYLAHADMRMDGASGIGCYAAQQSAEIAAMGVYVAAGVPHLQPFTRDIGKLLDGLEARGVSVPDEVKAADALTAHATEATDSRYPDTDTTTEADRIEAVRLARLTLEWARAEVARRRDKADG